MERRYIEIEQKDNAYTFNSFDTLTESLDNLQEFLVKEKLFPVDQKFYPYSEWHNQVAEKN